MKEANTQSKQTDYLTVEIAVALTSERITKSNANQKDRTKGRTKR